MSEQDDFIVPNTCAFYCPCGRLITIPGQIWRCTCGRAYKVKYTVVEHYTAQEINWMIQTVAPCSINT